MDVCTRSRHLWECKENIFEIDDLREIIWFSLKDLGNPNLELYWTKRMGHISGTTNCVFLEPLKFISV